MRDNINGKYSKSYDAKKAVECQKHEKMGPPYY